MLPAKKYLIRLLFICVTPAVIAWTTIPSAWATSPAANESIKVEITTFFGDKQTYKENDVISFLVSLDKDAYLLLVYQDAEGNLIQIIPNRYRKNNKYTQGLFVSVPGQNEPFQFKVKPPFGQETLWAFASKKSFPQLSGDELSNGLKKLSLKLDSMLSLIRSHALKEPYGESKTTINTEPK